MSLRELVALGTSSQIPTRHRNHNGYLLRWDDHGFLFDPGEGTQRQMTLAGVPVSCIDRILVTHFHGDHCLGLASIIQRISLDRVPHPVEVFYPESGQVYFERLLDASIYHHAAEIVPRPLPVTGARVEAADGMIIEALPLDHGVDTLGYRLSEPDALRFRQDELDALALSGPAVGELQRTGGTRVGDRVVTRAELSDLQPGAKFGFLMDTRLTANCLGIAADVDLLVCEATYLAADLALAESYQHMTAAQAATVARDAGARRLLLTHFSQRYLNADAHRDEAAAIFPAVEIARDLGRYPFPRPLRQASGARGGDESV